MSQNILIIESICIFKIAFFYILSTLAYLYHLQQTMDNFWYHDNLNVNHTLIMWTIRLTGLRWFHAMQLTFLPFVSKHEYAQSLSKFGPSWAMSTGAFFSSSELSTSRASMSVIKMCQCFVVVFQVTYVKAGADKHAMFMLEHFWRYPDLNFMNVVRFTQKYNPTSFNFRSSCRHMIQQVMQNT